jgi:hypothetical protein
MNEKEEERKIMERLNAREDVVTRRPDTCTKTNFGRRSLAHTGVILGHNFLIKLLIVLVITVTNSRAQNDTLNKYNNRGKKQGYWITYLDTALNTTEKKDNAILYGYTYYDNGKKVNPLQNLLRKAKTSVGDDLKKNRGNPVLINGTFLIYNKENKVEYEEVYENGKPRLKTAYSWDKNGNRSKETLDYQNKYMGQEGSFYFQQYNSSGELVDKFWYGRNEKGKWVYIKP